MPFTNYTEPNYSPPSSPSPHPPSALPPFSQVPLHVEEPDYTPPTRRTHHPSSRLPRSNAVSSRRRLGISNASRPVTKRGTERRNRASHLNSIARAITGAEDESELKEHYNLFTFHKRYLPYKPVKKGKGREPSPFGRPDTNIKEFWENFPRFHVNKDPSEREFLRPCSVVQLNHLSLFNKPTHRMPTAFIPSWNKAIRFVEQILSLPEKLPFPDPEGLQYVRFDPNKFAGVEYARRGLKKRADAHEAALQDAKESWACLMAGTRVQPHDVRLGGKGKIRDKAPPGTPVNHDLVGRLILMISHRDLLLLGNVEQVLTEAYLDPKLPIATGFRWCHGEPTKFADRLAEFDMFYCLDAFKFDANITDWLTIAALKILRNQFVNGNAADYDAYWEFVQESLIRVIIQKDDGVRMQKYQGSTSGHNFNSLVQSVITLLVGYTTFFYKAPDVTFEEVKRAAFLYSLGDELLMALKRPYSEWPVPEIAEVALEGCGIDWGGKKSFRKKHVADEEPGDNRGILFLGKRLRFDSFWVRGKERHVVTPYRPFQETVELLYYPHSDPGCGPTEVTWTYERTLAAYIDSAGNPDTRIWLDRLLGWLEQKGAKPPNNRLDRLELELAEEVDAESFPVPNPDRWDLQHWMEHTHIPRTNPRTETRHERNKRYAEKRSRIRFRWRRLGLRGGQMEQRFLYPTPH